MSIVDESLQARVTELEASNAELRRQLKLYAPPTDRLPGSRVVPLFFGLIALSVLLAWGLWTAGKKTSRERAMRVAPAPVAARVDQAGWALVQGIHGCMAELTPSDEVDIRLETRMTPAGTLGLIEAAVKPVSERFVPCVRRVPGGVKIEGEAGTAAPTIEVRYVMERPQDGSYQARWSWTQR